MSISTVGFVIISKCPTESFGDNLAMFEQRFSNAYHHLGVIGVCQLFDRRMFDDITGQTKGMINQIIRKTFKRSTNGVTDRVPNKTATKPIM